MSKKEKLLKRFLSKPKDFTYQELVTLLKYFGFDEETKGRTSGSRRMFVSEAMRTQILIHKPHPGNTISRNVIDMVIFELTKIGMVYLEGEDDE